MPIESTTWRGLGTTTTRGCTASAPTSSHFGIHGDPHVNAEWSKAELPDDPTRSTNRRGTFALAFPARPNSRTTQVYINKTDNARSDPEHFTVLGTVVEGMDVVDRLYAGYGEESGGGMRQGKQGPLLAGGNEFMDRLYPLPRSDPAGDGAQTVREKTEVGM